jgi:putative SOS response-associated peptidase YedK
MCGRFVLFSAFEVIAQAFGLAPGSALPPPSYNVTPGREIAIIVNVGRNRLLAACTWGFVPPWGRDIKEGHRMINARAESVAEKPSYRDAFVHNRCLVLADGFYEWRNAGGKKEPVYVKLRTGSPFGMAGIYSPWTPPGGETVCTTAIITTDANDLLRPVHDRMPAILLMDSATIWLDREIREKEQLISLLRPLPACELEMYAVSARVNSPKNDSVENIERVTAADR